MGTFFLGAVGLLASLSLAAESYTSPSSSDLPGYDRVETVAPLPSSEFWVTGATVMTAAGDIIESGTLHVKDGRIAQVGTEAPPDGATVIDASGQYVTPGIIDTHSHLGVYPSPRFRAHQDGNEMVSPATPQAWAEHALWPQDPGFDRALAGGVTAMGILPGSANLVGGRGVVVRPLRARGSRAMRFPQAPEIVKMACGENPKRVYGERGGPQTRMGNTAEFRDLMRRAQAYRESHPKEQSSKSKRKAAPSVPPAGDRNYGMETLVGVLDGDFLLQFHCYRADDMLTVLQVAREYDFPVRSFHHAVEAYKIRDLLAQEDVAVSTWSDWWGFKAEAYDAVLPNAAMVASAGGRAVIHSDSDVGIQHLNVEASKAWHDGIDSGYEVDENEVLRWITANAAWVLGIDDQTGTLEVGKRADFVIWDQNPFSVYARAEHVYIDGAHVHDAANPQPLSDFMRGQEVAP